MYACFTKNSTIEMFLASSQLRYEMSLIHIGHPVAYISGVVLDSNLCLADSIGTFFFQEQSRKDIDNTHGG